jgi:CHAT domain-containing protein
MSDSKIAILKESIINKNFTMAKKIIEDVDPKELNKEMLLLVIESKNDKLISIISKKTNRIHFDDEVLKKSIDTNSNKIVKKIADKTDSKFFTKKILSECVSKVGNKAAEILQIVSEKTNSELFDKPILDLALKNKNSDVVRIVVDYIQDNNLLIENKYKIQKSMLKSRDISNLTAQILSRKDNESFDRELQDVVFDIYIDVIKKHFEKSNIPKNFPITQFEESIMESQLFLVSPKKINFKNLNDDNKFLVLPVYSHGHAFSAVVRKLEDDKISVTFVNLGYRPFEKSANNNQYKEYVYTEDEALKILKSYSINLRIDYPQKVVSTKQAYKKFSQTALEEYTLNIKSRDQKVGNCFLKNIEKGLRYALALGISKAEDDTFNPDKLRVFVEGGGHHKVKFLQPIHKFGEKTNELTTLELRKDLVDSLITKFPQYETAIMKEWNIYEKRKTIKTDPMDIDVVNVVIDRNHKRKFDSMTKYNKPAHRKKINTFIPPRITPSIKLSRSISIPF